METLQPHLMFEGCAEEAMQFYLQQFPGAEILDQRKYKAGEGGTEGKIMYASFQLNNQVFRCIDSPVKHGFGFTPSFSIYVESDSEDRITGLFKNLSDQGNILMPLNAYPFSKKFAWVTDRFGVSWQLNYSG